MKQYLDPVQTSTLIELGFPQPKSVSQLTLDFDMDTIPSFSYSIGELIEFLPPYLADEDAKDNVFELSIFRGSQKWSVSCGGIFDIHMGATKGELIDTLFDVILELKKKGLI